MSGPAAFSGKFVWKELLSADEILSWFTTHKKPPSLKSRFSVPGIYRFVFPKFKDEHGSQRPCYVGESGNLARRIPYYFRTPSPKEHRDDNGELILPDGWHVRGQVQNAGGSFVLQVLRIEGALSLCGIVLNHHSFDSPFGRALLENWAILSSERIDGLHPTNQGIAQSTKELLTLMRCV